jgi:oligogalacturonide lyase
VNLIVTGRKTGRIYYLKDRSVHSVDPQTGEDRLIVDLPDGAQIATVNADETLLGGTITQWGGQSPATRAADGTPLSRAAMISARFNMRLPMELITIDVATGEIHRFNRCNDWLNHLQFSPTDPALLLFCHEGPWEKVDRIWTIQSDGSQLTKIHARTMTMEIAGHEFWSADGKTIYYDLQTPRGEDFWLAGLNVQTGQRIRYHLQRNEWSVHFNVSPDGTLFAGDGGSPGMVAHAPDGQWIYLFHPRIVRNTAGNSADQSGLITSGVFDSERLVNMSKHNYELEPNVTFSPDMKWIVFRSNMFGPEHVFAVEIAKAS